MNKEEFLTEKFDFINPLLYRYLPKDEELLETLLEKYNGLDIFTQLQRSVKDILVPRLYTLETLLLETARENQGREIPRRIDGQQEGKTTVDEVYKDYAKRLSRRIRILQGTPLIYGESESIENDALSDITYMTVAALSIEANIANDIRHLFRSEIEEVKIPWDESRIGSSTMPHKINPADFENIVSLWKAYSSRVISGILAQITEHQGDTTNKFLLPMTYEVVIATSYATKALENVLRTTKINV